MINISMNVTEEDMARLAPVMAGVRYYNMYKYYFGTIRISNELLISVMSPVPCKPIIELNNKVEFIK
jgi:hypothetical protein